MCDLSPDMQCLICYFQYATIQFVKFAKGQELEITFYVFSVHLGVETITFWGAFLISEGVSGRPSVCAEWDVSSVELPRNEHSTVVVTLDLCALDVKALHCVLQQLVVTSSLMI